MPIFEKLNVATLNLPQKPERTPVVDGEILMVTNADMLASANSANWPIQEEAEAKLSAFLKQRHGLNLVRAHEAGSNAGHGFINSQSYGAQVFSRIDTERPLIVFLTAWQYSHHIATSLLHHKGPILVLANFDGRFPGLVGALNLVGSLNSLGVPHYRLWSVNFDDGFFSEKFDEWLTSGKIIHDTSYLKLDDASVKGDGRTLGQYLGEETLQNKGSLRISQRPNQYFGPPCS